MVVVPRRVSGVVLTLVLLVPPCFLAALPGSRGGPGDEEPPERGVNVRDRLSVARKLLETGSYSQALDAYVWLWQNMTRYDPATSSVRVSFTASEIRRLVERHAPARASFAGLRDEAEERFKLGARPDDLADWIVLNEVLGENARTLAWFDAVKGDAPAAAAISRVAFRLERLLAESGRWADLGRLYPDPLLVLRSEQQTWDSEQRRPAPRAMSDEQQARIRETRSRGFQARTGRLYGGLLAAERPNDAEKVAAEARRLDDSPGMLVALVSGALDAGRPLPAHLAWAQEAGRRGEATDDLIRRLERGLAESPAR